MINTRNATIFDIKALAKLSALSLNHEKWNEQAFSSSLENETFFCIIATDNNDLIGFIAFYIISDDCSISSIAVENAHKNNGIATRLFGEMVLKAKEKKVEKIFLEVRESNMPAINFYKKMGFKLINIRKNFMINRAKTLLFIQKNFVKRG